MSARPSTPTRSSPSEGDLALGRSALWEALALGFRPPTEETIARLASARGAGALADVAALLDAVDGTGLAARARELGGEPVAGLGDLRAAYGRLFGHTARGLTPPYETEYGEDSAWEPQREMSDLGAFLRAFGLVLRRDAHERSDHVACESEFMLVLARKEAYALEAGDGEMLEITRRAARHFLRDHLGRWVPAFGQALARAEPGGFYGRLGALAAAFVTAECRRVGVPAGPDFLRLRSAEPDEAPMGCGPPADSPRT